MAKITEMTEDTAVGGAEKIYLVDGSQDKYALLTSLKSLFGSSITTITALKSYTGLSDGQLICVIDNNSAVAGFFYWDEDSTATGDDIDVVIPNSAITGRWIRLVDQNYLRSDANDTYTGTLTVTGNITQTGNQNITGTVTATTIAGTSVTSGGSAVWTAANSSFKDVAVLTGTVAHGGTIPLPSGYNAAQCQWIVSRGYMWNIYDATSSYAERNANNQVQATADGNRVVTLRQQHYGLGTNYEGYCNYLIIGVK